MILNPTKSKAKEVNIVVATISLVAPCDIEVTMASTGLIAMETNNNDVWKNTDSKPRRVRHSGGEDIR
jgi:hypothetical protein